MTVMTFEEWCEANQDLVEAADDETHPSGVSWGKLVQIDPLQIEPFTGDLGAFEHIESRLRSQYDEQVTRDAGKLSAWNAVLEG